MLIKIIKPLIVALIFYIITVLYGLISFHPLPTILKRGISAFLIGFFLSLFLKLMINYLIHSLENDDNNNNNNYKNVANEYQKSEKTRDNSGEELEENRYRDKDKEKEFNPLDPPVLETEDE